MKSNDIKDEKLKEKVQKELSQMRKLHERGLSPKGKEYFQDHLPKEDGFIMLGGLRSIEIKQEIGGTDVVIPSKVLDHLIRRASHRVIMSFCPCRETMNCKDYPQNLGCIFLGDAAKHISSEIGKAASVEEALAHVEKCRKAGLVSMAGRYSGDLRWLNDEVGPIERLVTVCHCCSCCCGVWTLIPQVNHEVGVRFLSKMPGVEMTVNNDCTGCGLCEEKCVFKAIKVVDGLARISEECRGCGYCADVCPADAVKMKVGGLAEMEKAVGLIEDRVDYK